MQYFLYCLAREVIKYLQVKMRKLLDNEKNMEIKMFAIYANYICQYCWNLISDQRWTFQSAFKIFFNE